MTVPAKRDVAVNLSACVLVVHQQVGSILAQHTPRVGGIDTQAREAFAAALPKWKMMAAPVVRDLVALAPPGAIPPGADMAEKYVVDLGEHLDIDAAAALAVAMDLQLSRGQHPDIAWQRTVAGYGLDVAAMRAYIAAATRAGEDGAAPLLSRSRALAQKALLAQADRVGAREVGAWSTLPVAQLRATARNCAEPVATPLSKEYDPRQRRDDGGRWTKQNGPRAQVKEKTKFAVPIAEPIDEPIDDADRYRYAKPVDADRYRYAATDADRYRYAADPDADRYRYGADADRYADPNRYTRDTQRRNTIRSTLVLLSGTAPNKTEPTPVVVDADGYAMSVPNQHLATYYYDRQQRGSGRFPVSRGVVDFDDIRDYMNLVRLTDAPVEAFESRSPWGLASGIENISDEDWQAVLAEAVPLHKEVMKDPVAAAAQLGSVALGEIAERAGYGEEAAEGDVKALIAEAVDMRERGAAEGLEAEGPERILYDEGLLHALADYLVWNEPEAAAAAGIPGGAELGQTLGDRIGRRALDDSPLPGVMTFSSGVADDDDGGDLRGRYKVKTVQYRSGIGTFDYAVPVGKIALRETYLVPEFGRISRHDSLFPSE